jgi:hypothetical protein
MPTAAAIPGSSRQAGAPDRYDRTEVYDRDGSELNEPGLYIDHAPWHFNVFVLRTI